MLNFTRAILRHFVNHAQFYGSEARQTLESGDET